MKRKLLAKIIRLKSPDNNHVLLNLEKVVNTRYWPKLLMFNTHPVG